MGFFLVTFTYLKDTWSTFSKGNWAWLTLEWKGELLQDWPVQWGSFWHVVSLSRGPGFIPSSWMKQQWWQWVQGIKDPFPAMFWMQSFHFGQCFRLVPNFSVKLCILTTSIFVGEEDSCIASGQEYSCCTQFGSSYISLVAEHRTSCIRTWG